jgi:hypothetical protein
MVSALKSDQSLKTTIGVDAELRLPIWNCGTCKAFLMHMSSALNAIKKQGTFKAYKEAHEAYVEQRNVAKQAMAALALLTAPTSKGKKVSKKASEKEPAKKLSEKEKASKKTKEGTALANAPAQELCNEYQALHDKATFAKEIAKNKCKAAATKMFQFYANLLSLDAKYSWKKIVREQTEADLGIFKACQGKTQGDFCRSHSTTASCFTFSLCFQTTQLNKKNTTFPTCSRNPRGLAYISLYST